MNDYIIINNNVLIVNSFKYVNNINPLHRLIEFELDLDIFNNKKYFDNILKTKGYLDVYFYNINKPSKKFTDCHIKYDKLSNNKSIYKVQISYTYWFIYDEKELKNIRKTIRNIFINEILNNV